jgi:hypothetical protein
MKRQGNGKSIRAAGYQEQLRRSMRKYLPFKGLPLSGKDDRVRWSDRLLVTGSILLSWSKRPVLTDAFEEARRALVSMYSSRKRPGKTATGFCKALRRSNSRLTRLMCEHLRQCSIQCAGTRWRTGRWVAPAVDGSRVECPHTSANEAAFDCGGRDKSGPQQWVTTVYHVISGLLWDYRKGKATDSERMHLRNMLAGLPRRTLLLMDAGFTGFDLLKSIMQFKHDFIVRVGANVTLLRELDYDIQEEGSRVWLWPRGKQGKAPPMKLRRVEFRSHGQRVCLLTNVLSSQTLSDNQLKEWYRQRWMIEVQYRGLKQTMSHRKLLSDSPEMARAELDWAIIGLWMLELMLVGSRQWNRSARYSLARGLRVVRQAMCRSGRVPAGGVQRQLRQAVLDHYRRQRPKQSRAWPHKKNDPPCGLPKIRMATLQEIQQAQRFHAKKIPA